MASLKIRLYEKNLYKFDAILIIKAFWSFFCFLIDKMDNLYPVVNFIALFRTECYLLRLSSLRIHCSESRPNLNGNFCYFLEIWFYRRSSTQFFWFVLEEGETLSSLLQPIFRSKSVDYRLSVQVSAFEFIFTDSTALTSLLFVSKTLHWFTDEGFTA